MRASDSLHLLEQVDAWLAVHKASEDKVSTAMGKVLRRQKREVISRIRQLPGIQPSDANRVLPKGPADVELHRRMLRVLLGLVIEGAKLGIDAINRRRASVRKRVSRVGTLTGSEGILIDIDSDRLEGMMQGLSDAWSIPYWEQVNETSRGFIRDTISRGLQNAMNERQIAREIERDPSGMFGDVRARRIARTEATTALNGGHWALSETLIEQQQDTGIVGKEWVTIGDGDVRGMNPRDRYSHVDADGQKVFGRGATFTVSGETARFPGDPTLSAGNRIGCRCTELDVFIEDVPIGELPSTVFQEPPAAIVPPAPVKAGIPSLGELSDTGEQIGGTTGARLMQDAAGRRFVVKRGRNAEHLFEEHLAEEMYRAAGVKIPESRLEFETGEPIKISRFIEKAKPLSEIAGDSAVRTKLQKHFAADATLGNWDAVGLELDNVLIDAKGTPWRIDVGGSLRFRAQGAGKGDRFADQVLELWTLQDSTTNPASARIFGEMTNAQKVASAKLMMKRRKAVLETMDKWSQRTGRDITDLRRKMASRFDSLDDFVKTSEAFQADKWNDSYVDSIARHEAGMANAGVFDRFPKTLKQRKSGDISVYDEDGKLFDGLRGPGSPQEKLAAYLSVRGGKYDIIEAYLQSQSTSSWKNVPQAVKSYYTGHIGVDADDFYWGPKGKSAAAEQLQEMVRRHGQQAVDETLQAWHAYNYSLCKRVSFPNNDRKRGVLNLARTEDRHVMDEQGIKVGDFKPMTRGAAESFSLHQQVTVSGRELTYQEVPHTRILGHYYGERGPGIGDPMFYGDSENEVVAMTHGIPVFYAGKSTNKTVLAASTWKKKIKGQ